MLGLAVALLVQSRGVFQKVSLVKTLEFVKPE